LSGGRWHGVHWIVLSVPFLITVCTTNAASPSDFLGAEYRNQRNNDAQKDEEPQKEPSPPRQAGASTASVT